MKTNIPKLPGIYVFKDVNSAIIYIGKAKCLYKRISSYFRRQTSDWKVQELIKEHASIEYIITKSETEALLLEAQLIGKFKPKYNTLLKSGNPFIYFYINQEEIPKIQLVKTKKKAGTYFGPFLNKQKVRSVFDYLTRTLKLRLCSTKIAQGCLDFHLGRCSGNCLPTFNIQDYKTRINLAKELLAGNYQACEELLRSQIATHNKNLEFEKSKHLNKYLTDLSVIFETLKVGFTEKKYNQDVTIITTPIQYKVEQPLRALEDLQILLKLDKKPITIDCFDISHFQSSYLVGSCIRFTHGAPDKNNFRRFKIKTLQEQNDYAALQEIVARRYKNPKDIPDVILIDGGKGQLGAIKSIINNITCISLAKREEILYTPYHPEGYKLDIRTPLGQLLIALRDYAHHFAISYHKKLRSKSF